MFIAQGIKPENKFWKYIVGSVIVIIAATIGQLPWAAAAILKWISEGKSIASIDSSNMLGILDSNLNLALLLLSFVVALGVLFLVIRNLHNQTILSVTTGRAKMDWSRVFFSFALWGIFTIVSTLIMYYQEPENLILNFKPIPFLILFCIATILLPIQTSTEEYIFRGYLMQGFANLSHNKWFPLVMTSVIFGTLHIVNPEVSKLGYSIMVYYIGTGLFLGVITLMDDGMELALGFHASNNLVGALLITSDWTVFQTESVFKDVSDPTLGFDVLLPIVVVFPVLLFIFSKKYGWTDWTERLTGDIIIEKENRYEIKDDTNTTFTGNDTNI